MFKKTLLYVFFLHIAFLAGCSNNVVDEANRVEKQKVENERTAEKEEQEKKEIQREVSEQKGSSIEEVKEEISKQKEDKKTVDVEKVEEKESFSDGEDFSQFVAKSLYDFETGIIDAESYYSFLWTYGSRVLLKELDSSKKQDIISSYEELQKLLNQKNADYKGYKISELTSDEPGIYAYFYRSVQTTEGEVNYITTIVKEGSEWKFDKEELSAGYNEK